jgi:hypothetical protein
MGEKSRDEVAMHQRRPTLNGRHAMVACLFRGAQRLHKPSSSKPWCSTLRLRAPDESIRALK